MTDSAESLKAIRAALEGALKGVPSAETDQMTLSGLRGRIEDALVVVAVAEQALAVLESGAELAPEKYGHPRSSPKNILIRAQLAQRQRAGGHLPRRCGSLTADGSHCKNDAMVWVDRPVCGAHGTRQEVALNESYRDDFHGRRRRA